MLENPVSSSGCVLQTFEKQGIWSSSPIFSDEIANSVVPTEYKTHYSCHFTFILKKLFLKFFVKAFVFSDLTCCM